MVRSIVGFCNSRLGPHDNWFMEKRSFTSSSCVFNSILTALVISQFIFHYFLGFLNVTPVKKEAMIKENLSFYWRRKGHLSGIRAEVFTRRRPLCRLDVNSHCWFYF